MQINLPLKCGYCVDDSQFELRSFQMNFDHFITGNSEIFCKWGINWKKCTDFGSWKVINKQGILKQSCKPRRYGSDDGEQPLVIQNLTAFTGVIF